MSRVRVSKVLRVKPLAQAVRRAFGEAPIPALYVGKYAGQPARWTS